jgi:hypothetical protein
MYCRAKFLLAAAILLGTPVVGVAQQAGASPTAAPAVVRRPKPLNYFFRSFLLPGWGQASLNRKLTGGIFVAVEGLALGMALKATSELHYLERVHSDLVEDKRGERQDWIVVMVANHLFAGLEAYVSASLFDFPGDLRAQALPAGGTGIGFSIRIPH